MPAQIPRMYECHVYGETAGEQRSMPVPPFKLYAVVPVSLNTTALVMDAMFCQRVPCRIASIQVCAALCVSMCLQFWCTEYGVRAICLCVCWSTRMPIYRWYEPDIFGGAGSGTRGGALVNLIQPLSPRCPQTLPTPTSLCGNGLQAAPPLLILILILSVFPSAALLYMIVS